MSSKSVAIRGCWSGLIVIRYKTDNLKAGNDSAIHYFRKLFVFDLLLPSRTIDARMYIAITS